MNSSGVVNLIWCCLSLDKSAIHRTSLQNLNIKAELFFLQVGETTCRVLFVAVLGNKLIVCLEALAKERALF